MVDPLIALQKKERVSRGIAWSAGVILAGLFVLLIVSNLVLHDSLADVKDTQKHATCVGVLRGDEIDAIARAFASPPAPNPERAASVSDLKRAATRFREQEKLCAAGKTVARAVPTQVSEPEDSGLSPKGTP